MDLLASNDRSSGNFINSSDHGEQEKTNRQQSELEYSEDLLATRSQGTWDGAGEPLSSCPGSSRCRGAPGEGGRRRCECLSF